ncbi:helix-turn-helix domain-containing protein [Nocardia sp. NPDC088792]|uniref:helix-turn-helix domain-containing protein n=1 Tax=Nocardia sp. NPDC088792 TaxID=3364332 RepID=UPI003810ECB6
MSKSQLAVFVRSRRDTLGMTQAQLAGKTGWSKSAIEKVEAGTLTPGLEFAGALFDALMVPYIYRERVVAALYPGALDRILGQVSGRPDADALADLEDLPYPAAYIALPEGEVLGANTAWAEAFPGPKGTSNMFDYLFTEPTATDVLVDWELITHGFTYGLRMMGPISVPQNVIDGIVERCQVHPDFERIYNTDPPAATTLQPVLRIRTPGTGEIRNLRIKIDKPHLPHSPWVTYRLVPVREL